MDKIKTLKRIFRSALEGDEYEPDPIIPYGVFYHLQITDIQINWTVNENSSDSSVTIAVTLERPGLLIGKGGRTIDALTQRLEKYTGCPVHIALIDTQIWK